MDEKDLINYGGLIMSDDEEDFKPRARPEKITHQPKNQEPAHQPKNQEPAHEKWDQVLSKKKRRQQKQQTQSSKLEIVQQKTSRVNLLKLTNEKLFYHLRDHYLNSKPTTVEKPIPVYENYWELVTLRQAIMDANQTAFLEKIEMNKASFLNYFMWMYCD